MANGRGYKIIKNSPELIVKVVGKTKSELLTKSGFAIFDLMTDLEKVQIQERLPLEVEGIDDDDLMVNWMRELLYLYQGSGYLLKEFEVHETREFYVRAEGRGEKYDPDRHEIQREIRAVVYHQCRIGKTGDQWTAQVNFEL